MEETPNLNLNCLQLRNFKFANCSKMIKTIHLENQRTLKTQQYKENRLCVTNPNIITKGERQLNMKECDENYQKVLERIRRDMDNHQLNRFRSPCKLKLIIQQIHDRSKNLMKLQNNRHLSMVDAPKSPMPMNRTPLLNSRHTMMNPNNQKFGRTKSPVCIQRDQMNCSPIESNMNIFYSRKLRVMNRNKHFKNQDLLVQNLRNGTRNNSLIFENKESSKFHTIADDKRCRSNLSKKNHLDQKENRRNLVLRLLHDIRNDEF